MHIIKLLYFLFFISLHLPLYASDDPLKGILFTEESYVKSDPIENHMLGMFRKVLKYSKGKLSFTQQQVTMTRGWVELQRVDNACMYNKYKDEQREKISIYSELPISIYPPLRFITLAKNAHIFPEEVSLNDDTEYHVSDLRIGVVGGRSYGQLIDERILKYPHSFFTRRGLDSSDKLIDMLVKGRVQGIIDYSDDIDEFLERSNLTVDYKSIPIHNVTLPGYGYIVCSKTDYGQKIIDAINAVMLTHEFQIEFVQSHKSILNKDEKHLLASEFEKIFVN
jgi:uncharacterized protein (TIGR02285 family)